MRDFIQGQRNYFAELEEAGEAMAEAIGAEPQDFASAARERLSERHRIEVRVAPVDIFPDALRRYDHHRKRLFLSEVLDGPGRAFALAYQLALLEHADRIDAITARAEPPDAPTRGLLRVSLANYLAAAVLMPYAAFHDTAERSAYDIGLMGARFAVSFEQACHRLTTLARPAARGVPFFMLRVDSAGNISKRFASAAFPFSRFGGTCPRWNLHQAFKTPGRIITQVVETPDGQRYFTLSRTVRRAAAPYENEDSRPRDRPGLRAQVRRPVDLFARAGPRLARRRRHRPGVPDLRAAGLSPARRRACQPHADGRRLFEVDLALSLLRRVGRPTCGRLTGRQTSSRVSPTTVSPRQAEPDSQRLREVGYAPV